MLSYILRRLAYGFFVLIGIVLLVFVLFNLLPADPARMVMGQRTDISSLESINKELGLDKPKSTQLLYYINDLSPLSIHEPTEKNQEKYRFSEIISLGNKSLFFKEPYLRRSYQTNKRVTEMIRDKFPSTLILALSSIILAAIIGIFLGIVAALRKDSIYDKLILSLTTFGISMPSFFAAIIIAWIFGFILSEYTGLNMTGSLYEYDPFEGQMLSLKNLILPTITLGIRPLSIIVQLTRNSMLDILKMDFIRTAFAKGIGTFSVIKNHALKNALNPVVTAISSWFASLLAGAFFVEYIFGWNGIGKMTVEALDTADFPVVMGAILFVGFLFVILNILADIAYAILDPRIKLSA